MAHLLLEDVTLRKDRTVLANVRLKGGALKTLELPLPLPFCVLSRTRPEVVEAIDGLLGSHDYGEIVDILNARGLRSGDGHAFNVSIIGSICVKSGLKTRSERGLLTLKEMGKRIGVRTFTVIQWRQQGRVIGYRSNYKNEYLYIEPTPEQITALKGVDKS
jgi:hypothetical protein